MRPIVFENNRHFPLYLYDVRGYKGDMRRGKGWKKVKF